MKFRLFIGTFLFVIGLCTSASAQTSGQVMFVGFNADGNDGFAFAALVDIPANTTIYFTDNEWDGVSAFNTGEGFNSWSHTAIVPAGTVITIQNLDNSPAITSTLGTAIVDGATAMNIEGATEVVYMYSGTNRTTPTTFLSAIANSGFSVGNGQLTATGLTAGVNAINIIGGQDVMVYRNNVNCNSTIATCAAAVANTSNWNTFNNAGNDTGNFNVCDVAGTLFFPMTTYYSRASGAWDSNTSWSLSSDGSTGAVPAGVWPRRTDNVVIRNTHTITINAVDDNKSCGNSPNGLNRSNVSTFTGSADLMFYHTGDILISNGATLVSTEEIMIEGYTHVESGGALNVNEDIINLGYFEVSASTTFSNTDDLILSGNSITIINNTSTGFDDIYIDHTDATLCGTGVMNIGNGSPDPTIQYFNGASLNQICSTFTVTCSMNCPGGFPMTGTGSFSSGISGPGGVAATNGNSELKVWLDASKDTYSDAGITPAVNGGVVQQWNDQSGSGNNATKGAGNEPIYTGADATINNKPAITFTATNSNRFNLNTFTLNPATSSFTIISALNITSTASNQNLVQQKDGSGTGRTLVLLANSTTKVGSFLGGTTTAPAATYTYGSWSILSNSFNYGGATTLINLFKDGTADGTNSVTPEPSDGGWVIGSQKLENTSFFNGRMPELIIMNQSLSEGKRIIIENYLSAKYNTPLAANDVYTMDNVGNGNYDHEVAGIGQAADGSNHRDARGTGVVRMWNPKDLANSEFLMWGHDNTALNSSTTAVGTAVDGTVIQERLSRIWRVSEVGDVGNVSISFDFSGVGGSPLGSNLRLLIDRDGNGFANNDVTPIVGSVSNGVAVFSNVNFQNGDRFTLGNTDASIPLPIDLVEFKAKPLGSIVMLTWATASELNNDFFTVERSVDAEQWNEVAVVSGAGTSTKYLSYNATDYQPFQGLSYYRLKQTDFDGTVTYSQIEWVDLKGLNMEVFPNPSTGVFRVSSSANLSASNVRVFNNLGQLINVPVSQEQELHINLDAYPGGVYILQVWDGVTIRSIRLVKR